LRVRPALREISEAMETANDFRDTPRGTLRINAALGAARRIFAPIVLPFLARHPDMHVDIVTDGRLVDIVAAGFDAGIRSADMVPRDMVAVPCSPPYRFLVVGSPAYFEKHPRPRSPADLHKHECIRRRMPSGTPLRWELKKKGEAVEVDVHGALTLDADELMIDAALRGLGLAWVVEWSVEQKLADGSLVSVLTDWAPSYPGLCLYYPPHQNTSAGLRAFVATLRTQTKRGATLAPKRGTHGRA
jgi:DNA-binding transcriptional LysR family regulator